MMLGRSGGCVCGVWDLEILKVLVSFLGSYRPTFLRFVKRPLFIPSIVHMSDNVYCATHS